MSVAPINPAVLVRLVTSVGSPATLTWAQSGKDTSRAAVTASVAVYVYSAIVEEGSEVQKVTTAGILAGATRDPTGAVLNVNGKTYKVVKSDPIVHNEHSLMHMLVLA